MSAAAHGAVEMRGISKTYRRGQGHKVVLLDGASLCVAPGERLGILGLSGAGKSTLLHLMAGFDDVYSGSIALFGRPLREMSSSKRAHLRRTQLGFSSQQGGLVHTLNVLQNITMPLWLDGRAEDNPRALHHLELLDIGHLARSLPQDLSGGEVARVALARALHHRPKLLLCDEPTHALDQDRRRRVLQALDLASAQGTTLVVATHDAEVAQSMSRCVTLAQGQLHEGSLQ